jgi:hypothetical protein
MNLKICANSAFAPSIDSVGWALFFIWSGVALLTHIGWTWSLFGTAVIILGAQAARRIRSERLDIFMIVIGTVPLAGTVAVRLGSAWSLIPAFLIVIGLAMLVEAASPDRRVNKLLRE